MFKLQTTVFNLNLILYSLHHSLNSNNFLTLSPFFPLPILIFVSLSNESHDTPNTSIYLPKSSKNFLLTNEPFVIIDIFSIFNSNLHILTNSPKNLDSVKGSPPAKFIFLHHILLIFVILF